MGEIKRISVTVSQRQHLEKIFNVTKQKIWQALTGNRNSLLDRKIRKHALQIGGTEIDIDFTTAFNEGKMVQKFGKRVLLVLDLGNGDMTRYIDGKFDACWSEPTWEDIYFIQNQTQTIVNSLTD